MADTARPRSRTPPRGESSAGVETVALELWQVLPEAGLDVRSSCGEGAEVLGHKARGTVVYGRLEAGAWVRLSDEPGFLPAEGEDGPVLRRAAAPAKPGGAANAGQEEAEDKPDAEAGTEAPAEEGAAAVPPEPEPPKPFRCHGCELGFDTEAELRAHAKASPDCSAEAWQAAVGAMACLPGAGTQLWCPACGEGHWTGSATKAQGLLRHLAAGAKERQPQAAQHARLWATLLALLLADPPPRREGGGEQDEHAETLQEWALRSRLLEATGPLLARPGPEARKAVRKLQDRTLGPDPDGPMEEPEAQEKEQVREKEKAGRKAKKAEAVEGPAYSFYNDDIPMDVFSACQDPTPRTADGVPIMDLLSSDEEPAPSREGLTEL